MIPVFRRLAVVIGLLLALGACADEDRDVAASVGDRELTFDEIADYQNTVLNTPVPDEAALNRPSAQQAATTWIRTAARLEALEQAGLGPSDAEVLDAELALTQRIEADLIPAISPSSSAYEEVVDIAVLSFVPRFAAQLTLDFESTNVASVLDEELYVSPRLGQWNPDSGTVVTGTG